jgi:hypothetical protein
VPKSERFKFDTAGWLFWIIVLVILAGPCIWATRFFIYETSNILYRIGAGLFLAAVGAGVVSWAVNAVLQWRQEKQRIARRKKAKKQK